MAVAARELADRLGLTGTHVFFNEGWVAYDDRQNYLLDADIGVSTHLDHVETAFSFRTRVLDYLWASLPDRAPPPATRSADLIEREGLGPHGAAGDVDALEEALCRHPRRRRPAGRDGAPRAGVAASELTWSRSWRRWWSSAGIPSGRPTCWSRPSPPASGNDLTEVKERWRGLAYDLKTAADHLREGGPLLAARKAAGRARRVASTWRSRDPA